jgi:hypothetical protein
MRWARRSSRIGALCTSTVCISSAADSLRKAALAHGDPQRAALLSGAAGGLRRRAGLEVFTALTGEVWLVDEIRQALDADSFDRAFAAGSRLNQDEAVTAIHDGRRPIDRAS